ncbi:glycosyltransferase [Gemmobacter caeruleus]|uniref:glycosyltransferase n=1 Tax=Gemmobacter caeruleus TaxID=2595004 RepID=UPI0011EFB29B|nr:glycosyltransferase [Gemmobacter caeruleus]
MTVQVMGLCRFSVPSLGAFQSMPEEIGARRAALYDPRRLARRLAWFEHVALPGLALQTDPDFTLVLLIGADLPEPWQGRLRRLVADLPQIRVVATAPGEHRAICAAAMRPLVDPAAQIVAQFRLDDDDAISRNFVQRIRRDLALAERVQGRHGALALDYAKGFLIRDEGGRLTAAPVLAQNWAPGLVLALPRDGGRFVLDYPHHQIWKRMPVLSLVDQIMFVRGAHDGNDSRILRVERGFRVPQEEIPRLLAERFAIDLDGFAAALAAAEEGRDGR